MLDPVAQPPTFCIRQLSETESKHEVQPEFLAKYGGEKEIPVTCRQAVGLDWLSARDEHIRAISSDGNKYIA